MRCFALPLLSGRPGGLPPLQQCGRGLHVPTQVTSAGACTVPRFPDNLRIPFEALHKNLLETHITVGKTRFPVAGLVQRGLKRVACGPIYKWCAGHPLRSVNEFVARNIQKLGYLCGSLSVQVGSASGYWQGSTFPVGLFCRVTTFQYRLAWGREYVGSPRICQLTGVGRPCAWHFASLNTPAPAAHHAP